jgi:hypothetical protein
LEDAQNVQATFVTATGFAIGVLLHAPKKMVAAMLTMRVVCLKIRISILQFEVHQRTQGISQLPKIFFRLVWVTNDFLRDSPPRSVTGELIGQPHIPMFRRLRYAFLPERAAG